MKTLIMIVSVAALLVLAYINGSIAQVDFGPERGVLPTYCADPYFTALAVITAVVLYLVEEDD